MNNLDNVLSDVAKNGLDIVFIYDHSGKIVWANRQMELLTGYSAEELGKISLSDVMPGVFGMSEDSVVLKVEALDEIINTSVYRNNHTCFPVKASIKECPGENMYYCSAMDISEYEDVKKQLRWTKRDAENAMKERNEFVANVTHELRTPVSGILGHTRNALDGELTPQINNTLRIIERCCGDMNKIIDNILDFSKLEAGKFVLEEREFDFKEFIDHIIETHIARINEKGLKFVFSMDDNVPVKVIGDSYHISQIINNLISNAIKFTSMGKITLQIVKTMQQGDLVELFFVVMDTGIGIKDEDRDKLFKSFSQVDASVSRKYGGTGLGLAVCRQIVEMMHGSINVESQHGHGSMFSFSIQVKVPESEIDSEAENNVTTIEAVKELIKQDRNDTEKENSVAADIKTIKSILEKLILCVEMESWEKAEMFADSLKQVLTGYPADLKLPILRLEMAVRKEDHDKAITACGNLSQVLENGGES